MTEKYNERNNLMSELHTLLNQAKATVAELEMAIMRENNAHNAKIAKTVTQETREPLNDAQRIKPLWASKQFQQQALSQSDAKSLQTEPPYENLIQ